MFLEVNILINSFQWWIIMYVSVFLLSVESFSKLTFSKYNYSGTLSEWQIVWIQIRPHRMCGLNCVQTVCKGCKQMTKVATSRQRINDSIIISIKTV